VELDDRVTIAMPEGVELDLQLAGLGSRFIAGIGDLIIQLTLIVVLALVTGSLSGGHQLDVVVFVIGVFVIWFGYPIGFELLARGRTPGKWGTHLRVVRQDGSAVDLPASTIRNFVRLVDGPTLFYVPTVISILVTRRNQRPGDIAAGTLVVREEPGPRPSRANARGPVSPFARRRARRAAEAATATATAKAGLVATAGGWDVSGLAARVAGAPQGGDAEAFLEAIVDLKAAGRAFE
jgi:uncharacterized RDD family membrane protein YckC